MYCTYVCIYTYTYVLPQKRSKIGIYSASSLIFYSTNDWSQFA